MTTTIAAVSAKDTIFKCVRPLIEIFRSKRGRKAKEN